ncbi:Uncharacterised protein [Bordetella pertussis]|nr:Uncharacterised protein [Bordetella pertussis]
MPSQNRPIQPANTYSTSGVSGTASSNSMPKARKP